MEHMHVKKKKRRHEDHSASAPHDAHPNHHLGSMKVQNVGQKLNEHQSHSSSLHNRHLQLQKQRTELPIHAGT